MRRHFVVKASKSAAPKKRVFAASQYRVGDTVEFDGNYNGVNPRIGTGKIIQIKSGIATHGNTRPDHIYVLENDKGRKFSIDECQITKKIESCDVEGNQLESVTAAENKKFIIILTDDFGETVDEIEHTDFNFIKKTVRDFIDAYDFDDWTTIEVKDTDGNDYFRAEYDEDEGEMVIYNDFDDEVEGATAITAYDEAGVDKLWDEISEINQEFTSENTSINAGKIPALFKMKGTEFQPGTINVDYGGGKFDNVADYLTQYDVINLVFDPFNRTSDHNKEVIQTIRKAGGADTATCSNVLNVIKEPEVRKNVLQNISKLTKDGGKVYITVYEGSGKGNEGATKSGYQLNRKTADYLAEIQEVFPDATRKGKLIIATNGSSVSASTKITASNDLKAEIFDFLDTESGYGDYYQYIEDLMEEFNLDRDSAETWFDRWALNDQRQIEECSNRIGAEAVEGATEENLVGADIADIFNIAENTLSENAGSVTSISSGASGEYFLIIAYDVGTYRVSLYNDQIVVEDGDTGELLSTCKNAEEFMNFIYRVNNIHRQMVDEEEGRYSAEASTNVGAEAVEGAIDPEPSLDPPSSPEPEEVDDEDEIVEIPFDCNIRIHDETWDYEDEEYAWANGPGTNGNWYTEDTNVFLGDNITMVECIDDLLQLVLPDTEGVYHISGTAHLVFEVSGVAKYSDFQGIDEDGDPIIDDTYDTGTADAHFSVTKSSLEDFKYEVIS